MALKPCLYCNKHISEAARACPQCGRSRPFDATEKALSDEKLATQKRKEDVLNSQRACPECGKQRTLVETLKNQSCPSCGFPDARPCCSMCENTAKVFDDIRGAIVCDHHKVDKCSRCRKDILENKVAEQHYHRCYGGSTSYYHWQCSSKYLAQMEADAKRTKFFTTIAVIGFALLVMISKCSSH